MVGEFVGAAVGLKVGNFEGSEEGGRVGMDVGELVAPLNVGRIVVGDSDGEVGRLLGFVVG